MNDISLIGTGIQFDAHLTPEAVGAIRRCRRLYHLTACHERLSELCPGEVIDWNPLYQSTDCADVYQEMAEILLDEGRRGPTVGFAVYGHPLVLVSTSRTVISQASRAGLSVEVVSGISSIDVLLQHLRLETGVAGLQVFEVNHMVLHDIVPNPYVSTFVMQVSAYGARILTKARRNHPERFIGLQKFLLRAYRPNHPVVLVTAPFTTTMELTSYLTSVGELADAYKVIHTGMSMYLPALAPASVNEEFRKQLEAEEAVFSTS